MSWVHKGCTGLFKSIYDKFFNDLRKKGSHNWESDICKQSQVRRLSISMGSGSHSCRRENSSTRFKNDETVATMLESQVMIKNQLSNTKKTNATNKDIISAISHKINLILSQRTYLQETKYGIVSEQTKGV